MADEIIEGLEDVFTSFKGSIAVVGNGVFKKEYGKYIDKHDGVIRFNNFVFGDYVPFVGHKITWWCTHPYIENYEHHYNPSISHRKYKEFKVNGTVIIPKHDYWGEYRKKYFKILSSGMTILLILDKLGIDVNAYGFDNFETGHYWDPKHERNPQHKPLYEKEIQEKLTHVRWHY
jgi:hypothetical protein